jgi:hypothetical protein
LTASLAAPEIVRRRLAAQFLSAAGPLSAGEIVRALGAVQSQDYAGARWALGLRARGLTDADVERAFAEGQILRTHVLRPTWHFVTPDDIRWLLALTAPRVKAALACYDRALELDAAVFRRSHAVLTRALRDGGYLTRTELRPLLERAGVAIRSGQRLAHIMLRAELDAVVCSGPRRGKQFTYALLEERVAPAASPGRDEALGDLTRRYFATRGPATLRDFCWWSGLTMSDAKRGVQIVGSFLQRARVRDDDCWFMEAGIGNARPSAHLLPNYDEYFIGYKDRSAIAQRIGTAAAVTGGNALIAHVVFVNGQLVGGWKRVHRTRNVVVEMTLGARLTGAERDRVAAAARRLSAFLDIPVLLRQTGQTRSDRLE